VQKNYLSIDTTPSSTRLSDNRPLAGHRSRPNYKYCEWEVPLMPRVDADISPELWQRLKLYISRTRGALFIQESDVIAEAIAEYLDRHERRLGR